MPLPFQLFPKGLTIPQTALCHRPTEGDYLWVVNSKTQQVTKRKVKKGDLLPNGYVSITEGLYPDETVANSGLPLPIGWNENKCRKRIISQK